MRVKMIVAYDGTNYKGWQVQPNGITIEEVLNKNLSNLLGEQIVVSGASRTDSGVHSLGNIAVFDTNTRMPADKIAFAFSGTRLSWNNLSMSGLKISSEEAITKGE